jgi:hypothetical protein
MRLELQAVHTIIEFLARCSHPFLGRDHLRMAYS